VVAEKEQAADSKVLKCGLIYSGNGASGHFTVDFASNPQMLEALGKQVRDPGFAAMESEAQIDALFVRAPAEWANLLKAQVASGVELGDAAQIAAVLIGAMNEHKEHVGTLAGNHLALANIESGLEKYAKENEGTLIVVKDVMSAVMLKVTEAQIQSDYALALKLAAEELGSAVGDGANIDSVKKSQEDRAANFTTRVISASITEGKQR
jgi:hypothetical protein